MNSFDKKVLDKIAKDFSCGSCQTWNDRKTLAITEEWAIEDKKVERAVALARQEMMEKIEKIPFELPIDVSEADSFDDAAEMGFEEIKKQLRSFLQAGEKKHE